MDPIGVYIHIPFCEKKCPYCNFYSVNFTKDKVNQYISKLLNEIKSFGKKLKNRDVNTIYLGGGTPSLLSEQHIENIIASIKENFNVLKNTEITMELNPNSANKINFSNLLNIGINRLSIGMQSSNNQELEKLGRLHTAKTVKDTVKKAQIEGFNNISLDLMVAVPAQTIESLIESINFCKSLNIQHISMYLLKVEPNTPFFKNKNNLNLLCDDDQAKFYLKACEEIEKVGFYQYEISNFSILGYESRHNLKYWQNKEYLGIGPSAHSFINKKRFHYKDSLEVLSLSTIINDGIGGTTEEYAMLNLRLTRGLENKEFFKKFKKDIPKEYFKKAKLYEKIGLTKVTDNSIKFTKKGFLVSNELISQIVLS